MHHWVLDSSSISTKLSRWYDKLADLELIQTSTPSPVSPGLQSATQSFPVHAGAKAQLHERVHFGED